MKTAKSALFFALPRRGGSGGEDEKRAAGVGAAGKARGGGKAAAFKKQKAGQARRIGSGCLPGLFTCAAADYRMAAAMSAQSASTFSSVVAQLVHRRIAL